MPDYRFYCPIQVRYGDLDPQGHVNNARYLTYIEQARVAYLMHLGLWDGRSFVDVGIIIADVKLTFLAPVLIYHSVQVGVRVSHLGNKSLTMEYMLEDAQTGQEFARSDSVLVTYDYASSSTISIPENWRRVITAFEDIL